MGAKIKIRGKEYPCRQTMGALLRYKRETGQDISKLESSDASGMVIFLWCCVVSASKADGVEFNLSLEEFADSCELETLNSFTDQMAKEAGESKKKVKVSPSQK
ncbi:MAG: hypothetical protein E7108_08770 [Bacteroidales bacterium]|jgi:hypothetical protein|nr:hypothetical protein [Bacteroidales bacterium]